MREILFRGKRFDNGEWVEGGLVKKVDSLFGASSYFIVGQGCSTVMLDSFFTWHIVDPDTVGQYTGLTDKNDKKIFEGDIVKLDDGEVGCVVYIGSGFALPNGGCSLCVSSRTDRVIIGNTHENPELSGGAEDAAD